MDFPAKLDPKNPLFNWLNRFLDAAKSSRPVSNQDIKVQAGPGGSFLSLNKPGGLPTQGFHPFEIYRFPKNLRKHKNSNDARRFKVRGGYIIYTDDGEAPIFPVWGSDSMYVGPDLNQFAYSIYGIADGAAANQVPPNDGSLIVPGIGGFGAAGWNEFVVSEGVGNNSIEVWISLVADDGDNTPPTSTFAAICVGLTSDLGSNAINLATGAVFNDNWAGFPYDDPYHVYIGQVAIMSESDLTTFPNALRGQAVITQVLRDNVKLRTQPYGLFNTTSMFGLDMRWCGEYSDDNFYWPGDVVTITTGSSPGDTLKQWIYDPTPASNYYGKKLKTSMGGVSPATNSPDPWKLISITTF